MLKRIVMQLSGRGTALFIQASAWLKTQLCKRANNLRVSYILASLSVGNLLRHLVKTLSSFKALAVNLITQALSIKAVLKRAATISGQIGRQLVTTARQTLQRVMKQLKQSKKRVASIKLVQLVTQKLTRVLTPTGPQSKGVGPKQQDHVRQRRPRAQRQNFKGR